MFQSLSQMIFGFRYKAEVHLVQDFDLDPKGNYIYAESTITKIQLTGATQKEETHYINNRGFSIVNGQKRYHPPFYTIADSVKCLDDIIKKAHAIGRI